MIAMTHTHKKRWLSGFGTSAILHVTHPLAITSANKLIQCAVGKRVGIVVRTRGEKGVGGVWKEGLEDKFFLPHCYRSKSLNLLTLWADRKLSHLTSCFLFTKIAVLFKLLSRCVPLFVCVKQSHPSSIDLWEFSSGYGLICAAGFSQPWCTKILGYLW